MTETPTNRDLAPPEPPADEPDVPTGLMLGIDIEELYFFFGEAQNVLYVAMGIGSQVPAMYRHTLNRIRAALWSLPDGTNLVRQLDDILAAQSTSTATSSDLESVRDESTHLAELLDGLLRTVREALPDPVGRWYDLGIFLARLHLCLCILESPTNAALKRTQEIYLRELLRVVPLFARTFLHLVRPPSVSPAPTSLIRSLLVLVHDMPALEDDPPGTYRIAREHADAVFTAIGVTDPGISPLVVTVADLADRQEAEAEADATDPAVELSRQHERCSQALYTDAEPETAEEGLRSLLVTARRTLGPDHPLVFMIQSDLTMALLALGRFPLCVELALDTAEEAAVHLGARHPLTVSTGHAALRMLLIAGRTEEAAAFFHDHLAWLLAADPDDLSEELRVVRDVLHDVMTAGESGASP